MGERLSQCSRDKDDPGASTGAAIRVVLTDDHAGFRQRLAAHLARAGDVVVVGQAGSGGELLKQLRDHPADVLCLDVHMPGPGLTTLIRQVLGVQPFLQIVILTMHDEEQYVTDSFDAGARGFVLKESLTSRLLPAIRAVRRGKTYVDPAVVRGHA